MNRIDRAPHLSAFIKYLLWVNHAGRHGDALVKERDLILVMDLGVQHRRRLTTEKEAQINTSLQLGKDIKKEAHDTV